MSDDALIAWLTEGATPQLSEAELAARRSQEFARRFLTALRPDDDLGPTCELHEAAVAERVKAVHDELNPLGEIAYGDVWALLGASDRAAIKKYLTNTPAPR